MHIRPPLSLLSLSSLSHGVHATVDSEGICVGLNRRMLTPVGVD